MNKTDNRYLFALVLYFTAGLLILLGLAKMFADQSGSAFTLINAIYAIDLFLLALLCTFIGFAIQIMTLLKAKIEPESERQADKNKKPTD